MENIELLEIENRIFTVRGVQVMLDSHLAEMYQVETKILNRAVKRNEDRFPESFRFQVSNIEYENMRFQIGTLNEVPLRSRIATLNKGVGQHRENCLLLLSGTT